MQLFLVYQWFEAIESKGLHIVVIFILSASCCWKLQLNTGMKRKEGNNALCRDLFSLVNYALVWFLA